MDTDIDVWIRRQVTNSEIISKEKEEELLEQWLDKGNVEARNELILAHQKLVASMAAKFSNSGANFSDLFNEGCAALIWAADKFDRTKANRFSTYGAWWIFSKLQEAVHRDIYTVKIGRSRTEKKVLRLLGVARNFLGPNLESTIISEIAEFAETDVETIEKIDGAMSSRSVSINSRVGSDSEDGAEVGDLIEDRQATEQGAEAVILNKNQRALIETLFERLTDPRAPEILRCRWLSEEDISLKEIGEKFSVSAERIRQIERDALKQLRLMLAHDKADISDILAL